MKKFTALMLVVLMVVTLIPFGASAATTWTKVDTAEEFAAMTDGNYWLTADIDLSKVNWTTIAKFSGTLNGNGKTVTVPKDAPIFDTVTGTVKNVNLKGDMALTSADLSPMYITGDINGNAVGVLANNVWGGTIDNVNANVNVTFKNDKELKKDADGKDTTTVADGLAVSFGFVGFATADYTVKVEEVAKEDGTKENKYSIEVGTHANITNCTVAGDWTLDFVNDHGRNNAGTIVGAAFGGVEITKCVASAKVACANAKGNKGGIIGHVNGLFQGKMLNADTNVTLEDKNIPVNVSECLYNGEWTLSGTLGERYGGVIGYGRDVNITKTAVTGKMSGGGSIFGLFGYANANGDNVRNEITNSIFVGQIKEDVLGSGVSTLVNTKKTKAGATLVVTDIYRVGTDKVVGSDETQEGKPNTATTKDYADAAAAIAAFAAANNAFEVKNGALVLKTTAFTPEADPADPKPAPTGDMTIALVAVAVVSLAAVTVIAKKKVTE